MYASGMRKFAGAVAAAAILTIGLPLAARADNVQVLLLGGTTQTLTFQGTGNSNVDVLKLGTCASGICTWAEAGKGSISSGLNQLEGYTGLWSLSTPYSGNPFNLTLTSGFGGNSNDWAISQENPLTFDWGAQGCSGSSCYLTGTLELTDILQSGQGGIFDLGLDANLTITGGSLANLVGPSGIYDYTVDFSSNKSLHQITDDRTLTATGSSGEVLASTPEPESLVLLASGLCTLLAGSFFRRRQSQQAS
jgi:hypothetical protein